MRDMYYWLALVGSLLFLLWVLIGCAGERRQRMVPEAAMIEAEPEPLRPAPLVTLPETPMVDVAREPVSQKEAEAATAWANKRSVVRPKRQDFAGVVVFYKFVPGGLYDIHTEPHKPTDIVFAPGETIRDVQGGDPKWWEKSVLTAEQAGEEESVSLVPKLEETGETRYTVVTSKGRYYLTVSCCQAPGMVAVRWQHPGATTHGSAVLAPGVYYTGYDRLATDPPPPWTPLKVWNTGQGNKTLIRFPPGQLASHAPILRVLDRDGTGQQINFRRKADWYIVDQIFERGELRLGLEDAAEVVTIQRGDGYQAIRCPADPLCPRGDL